MPEFRRDPTTDDWVIVAAERARRPGGARPAVTGRDGPATIDPSCPFCPGNEGQTPPEVLRRPHAGEWTVRVVPNKYPALVPDATGSDQRRDPLRAHLPARGRYEVIIEGRRHHTELAPHDDAVLAEVLYAAQERLQAFQGDPALEFASLFRNHGPRAGASLRHPHWQLAAAPVVPGFLARMLEIARRHLDRYGVTLYQALLDQELADGIRIVEARQRFVVLAPYAPQWAGEVWIVPGRDEPTFAAADPSTLAEFAGVLRDTLERLAGAFDNPDCNVVVVSAPLRLSAGGFRWHVRIQPRLTVPGGFELGSGIAITTMAPEQTAALLREIGR